MSRSYKKHPGGPWGSGKRKGVRDFKRRWSRRFRKWMKQQDDLPHKGRRWASRLWQYWWDHPYDGRIYYHKNSWRWFGCTEDDLKKYMRK